MISMTVTNHLSETLEMILSEPEKTGLLIDSIEGLGEPEAKANIMSIGLSDYSRLNSTRMEPREITIKLIYCGDDIESCRLMAYKYFPTKEIVNLQFETDYRNVECNGVVIRHEPIIFDKECGCTIDIRCPDPYFYDLITYSTRFEEIKPLFHFPFTDSNEDEIQFGHIIGIKEKHINYYGEESTGVIIKVHCKGDVRDFGVYNITTGQQMVIKDSVLENLLGSSLKAQDDIYISTDRGQKFIYLLREGSIYNIVNALERRNTVDDWIRFIPGDNLVTYSASTGMRNVIVDVEYKMVYKGV